MKRPNLFIVGAPKCGTTALSEYLREHPNAFVTKPKEPHFFCTDFPYYYAPGKATLDHYLQLFADADDRHLAVCEASVWYLYSQVAAANIRAFDPDARFIAMVRNPVDMVPSLHSQMLFVQDEDRADPWEAWRLGDERRAGRSIPGTCRVPGFIIYADACSLGRQVERLLATVPRDQVKIIVHDDFLAEPGRIWQEVQEFAGLPDDGRREFPVINANKRYRNQAIARFSQRPPRSLMRVAGAVKRWTGLRRIGFLHWVKQRNRIVTERAALDPAFVQELREYFADDVALLGRLLDRDLSHWLQPTPKG